ncbi:SDR family oxidoreductase [Methylobacterium nonmethylotrophicum]|uniref:SDR family NAD(P)-dependent oxidoreductase n=1 Tax=Methylobacterium nonmethylotrophicum TaxID=1141884 RepID=A0A4Z0NU61_9HYPH|nr:SDR family oxidoreductase [Methylobacterium nonmethylotrophicum]TGD99776.1 SDR family NAD(P)-dependent oxidoreductase [Methylobacterium nonmethylotrophicum]
MSRTTRPTVVVTGGSAGIGRAVAVAFGRRGWNVGILARGRAGIAAAVEEVRSVGGRALGYRADVADPLAVDRAADAVAEEFGGLDVWVNNAMATVYAEVQDTTPEEFRRVTDVTYLGQVHGTLAALRHMREADRGTIVQVGSALAYRSIPLQAAYCGAKSAVRGFVDSLRTELLHHRSGIRLTMVQLPAVNTPQFDWARSRLPRRLRPVPPIFQPDAIAEAIVRAAHDAPRELWIGTPSWLAILGAQGAPAFTDHYLARNGYEGEMTDEPADRGRPDNLFDPLDSHRDHGAHGRFDAQATDGVVAADPMWLHLGMIAAAGLIGGAALAAGRRSGRRDPRIAG